MDGQLREVMDAVQRLSERVGAIERRLGMHAPEASAAPSKQGDATNVREVIAPVVAMAHAAAPPIAPREAQQPAHTPPIVPPLALPLAPPKAPPVVPAVALPSRAGATAGGGMIAPAKASAGAAGWSVERLIGGRLYAVLGALILIVGIGLFLKLGIDRGWFTLPPALRCIAGGIVGFVLIAGGEIVRKRLKAHGDFVASGLTASGLAAMFASVLVARGVYELVPPAGAFALLVVVSAFGIGLALRAGSLVLAILALAGAYINPVAVGGRSADPAIMPAYLMALLVVGLVLSWWRPKPFRWLRSVVWIGHALLGLAWLAMVGHKHELLALGFLGMTWVLIHAELLLGARRLPEGAALGASLGFTPTRAVRVTLPMVSSFGATAYCVGLAVLVAQGARSGIVIEAWWLTALGFVAAAVLGFVLAGNLRVLRDPPQSDAQRLGVALFAQAGALLIATVALGLSNWTQALAWVAMGVAAVAAGRWAGARAVLAYGYLILLIATGRLVLYDSWAGGGGGGAGTLALGLWLSRWSLLMAIGGGAWIAAALLTRKSERVLESGLRATAVDVAVGFGLTMPVGGLLSDRAEAVLLIAVAGVLAAGVAWAARWRGSIGLAAYALVVLFATCAGVVIRYVANFDGGWEQFGGAPLAHPGLIVGCIIGVLGVLASRAMASPDVWRRRAGVVRVLMVVLASVLVFGVSSLEIARSAALLTSDRTAQGAAVSIFWGVVSVAMIVVGFLRSRGVVRHVGLGLLGVAAMKTVIFDLEGVGAEWRIASLIGVGVLMLLVALGYARVASRMKEREQPPV